MGWSSVLQQTKAGLEKAQHAVEEQQHKIKERIQQVRTSYYKRDPNLPLDVPALKDAEVIYITDRIITMGHPAMASSRDSDISGERKLAAIGHLLHKRHDGKYMVWNLSEVDYDNTILDEQVLTFSFPGSPSPPLGLLLKLLMSMESWLKADERNVAVVHCLTGKGRTSTVVAAFLCWMGEAGFDSANIYDALEYIAQCKQTKVDDLTIPSQRRYASYFQNMLENVRPSQPPLMLKRIIMSAAPKFARGPPRNEEQKTYSPDDLLGCAPYLQLFRAGQLLHTVPASLHFQQSSNELPFCQIADGAITFNIDRIVQGDILIRCRHLTAKRQRVSMFRAAFHTGYAPPKVMRLTKSQLDGACDDNRFADDFFLDVIFEPVNVEEAGKVMEDDTTRRKQEKHDGLLANQKGETSAAVSATAYDSMLQRDSRFWDVISARRRENSQKNDTTDTGATSGRSKFNGPTVGRRRVFKSKAASQVEENRTKLEAFSIGGELDFLRPEEPAQVVQLPSVNDVQEASSGSTVQEAKKPDSLMEALMSLDTNDEDDMDEEIIFEENLAPTSETRTSSGEEESEKTSVEPRKESLFPEDQVEDENDDLNMDDLLEGLNEADLVDEDDDLDDDDLKDLEDMLSG